MCHLDVNVTIYDPKKGSLVEATSSPNFWIEDVVEHKNMNRHLIISDIENGDRKFLPQKNYIEEQLMSSFMNGFKNLKKRQGSEQQVKQAKHIDSPNKKQKCGDN